jgi:hypothetical protein
MLRAIWAAVSAAVVPAAVAVAFLLLAACNLSFLLSFAPTGAAAATTATVAVTSVCSVNTNTSMQQYSLCMSYTFKEYERNSILNLGAIATQCAIQCAHDTRHAMNYSHAIATE